MSNDIPDDVPDLIDDSDDSPDEFPRNIGRIGCPPGKKKISRDNVFWCKCFKDIEAAQKETGEIP